MSTGRRGSASLRFLASADRRRASRDLKHTSSSSKQHRRLPSAVAAPMTRSGRFHVNVDIRVPPFVRRRDKRFRLSATRVLPAVPCQWTLFDESLTKMSLASERDERGGGVSARFPPFSTQHSHVHFPVDEKSDDPMRLRLCCFYLASEQPGARRAYYCPRGSIPRSMPPPMCDVTSGARSKIRERRVSSGRAKCLAAFWERGRSKARLSRSSIEVPVTKRRGVFGRGRRNPAEEDVREFSPFAIQRRASTVTCRARTPFDLASLDLRSTRSSPPPVHSRQNSKYAAS